MNDEPAAPTTVRRVGWREVGVAAAVAVVLYGLGIAVIWSVPDGAGVRAGLTQYAVSGLAPLGAFAAAVLFRLRDVRPFGLRRVSWRWLLVGVAGGAGAIALSIAVTVVVVTLTGPPSNLQADYQAASTGGPLALVATLLLGAVLTPIGEEFLFRGVLANALDRYGPWVAVLGSASVFAVAHGISYILPVAFIVGAVSVLLLRRSGSIWPGVLVHAVNNAYAIVLPAIVGVTVSR